MPRHGLADDFRLTLDLITDRGTNEVSPVRVKSLFNEQIDLAEINVT